jgi:hypothetical protein
MAGFVDAQDGGLPISINDIGKSSWAGCTLPSRFSLVSSASVSSHAPSSGFDVPPTPASHYLAMLSIEFRFGER